MFVQVLVRPRSQRFWVPKAMRYCAARHPQTTPVLNSQAKVHSKLGPARMTSHVQDRVSQDCGLVNCGNLTHQCVTQTSPWGTSRKLQSQNSSLHQSCNVESMPQTARRQRVESLYQASGRAAGMPWQWAYASEKQLEQLSRNMDSRATPHDIKCEWNLFLNTLEWEVEQAFIAQRNKVNTCNAQV